MSNINLHIDFLSGLAIGYIYYDPTQEFDNVEEFFEKHQFCLLFFVIVLVIWRKEKY